MKIVFLCGSLEPGRDGVGDYVRRLALELMQQGHHSGAIALNDKHTAHEVSGFQQAALQKLPILRLPSTWPANKRFEHAQRWIYNFDPNWLSLQFVPFSFHPKGLPFDLAGRLGSLGKGRLWHIMMHELWVGMDSEATIKYKLWGSVQRFLIKSLITHLNPKIIHTQTLLYQIQLARLGFNSVHLPLFSNIPIALESFNPKPSLPFGKEPISLVLFGVVHPGAPVEEFAQEVAHYARTNQVTVNLVLVGRYGGEQERWATGWKAVGLPVELLGEQPSENVSKTLAEASLGIATTPPLLLEKSGTAAAMQEHGLTVLCVSRPWNPRGIDNLQALNKANVYQRGNFETFLRKEGVQREDNNISNIAHQFTNALLGKAQ